MGTGFRFGLTEPNMKECGRMEKQQARENSFMLMVISTMESGVKTRHAGMGSIYTTTELGTKANGSRTISMVMELRNGWMEVVMKECTSKAKNMEMVNIVGEMVVFTMEIGLITR